MRSRHPDPYRWVAEAREPTLSLAVFARAAALESDASVVARELALAGSIKLVEAVVVLGLEPAAMALTASEFRMFGPRYTYQLVY